MSNSDVEATPGYTSTDVAGCNAGSFSIKCVAGERNRDTRLDRPGWGND